MKKTLQELKNKIRLNNLEVPYRTSYSFGDLVEIPFSYYDPDDFNLPEEDIIYHIDVSCETISLHPSLLFLFSRSLVVNEGTDEERTFYIFNHKSLVVIEEVNNVCKNIDVSSLDILEPSEEKRMKQFIHCLIGDDINYENEYLLYPGPIAISKGYLESCWTNFGCQKNGHINGTCSWKTFNCQIVIK